MANQFLQSWRRHVKNLDDVMEQLHQQATLAISVVPYQRIIPALFMKPSHYQIFSVRDSADLDLLKNYAEIYCLEQHDPKLGKKVQSTEYLIKNYWFQSFLKRRKLPTNLLFYQTTKPIIDFLNQQNIPWIGNDPKIFEPVVHKDTFRNLLKSLKLPHLDDWTLSKEEFEQKTYEDLYKKWNRPVVVQPGDYEITGSTLFIHKPEDIDKVRSIYQENKYYERVKIIKISPFVVGETLSMLGCVMEQGVLSSPLQLQLIDVPESLHGYPPIGMFFGHDWGYRPWSGATENQAQKIVESLGNWLFRRGYRGIFGIDFIWDKSSDELFPLECNPRFTGAIPAYSQLNLLNHVPPIDFFTLVSYYRINIKFDFNTVNELWKKQINAAHIAITPQGIQKMNVALAPGIYTYHPEKKQLEYLRPGAFLHELKNDEEFIIIDQVPRYGQEIMQNVPRLFKFIFPQTIAEATHQIKPKYSEILSSMGDLLRR